MSWNELEEIHNKMETELGKAGAYLDGIYFCPHHPHKGYEQEVVELKINCECRKPKPGMILKAAEDFNIDLSQICYTFRSNSKMEELKLFTILLKYMNP